MIRRHARSAALLVAGALVMAGCGGSDSDSDSGQPSLEPASDNYEAEIRRTTNGVPHIKADTLGSAAFGVGYAQASDNVCTLAEAFVRARSQRARYFGPGPQDSNIISDFSLKALDVIGGARRGYEKLSAESRAMIDGFTAGYNRFVKNTEPSELPPQCQGQPWVQEIDPVHLLAHYRVVAQRASGGLFATGAVFSATPPGESVNPQPVMAKVDQQGKSKTLAANIEQNAVKAAAREQLQPEAMASNAWGIGRAMTANGKGALLGNPHFPYTGPRRLYQMQMTVPDYLNVQGAGLLGTAIPLISFNENLAWSHTVTTSRRFTFYELTLKSGDNLTYLKDGQEKPITTRTLEIKVNTGAPELQTLEREFYFSEYGPMINANAVTEGGLPAWGDPGNDGKPKAYAFRDANKDRNNLLDTWLGMSRASNLEEFKDVFRQCGSTLWTNTVYADDQGNAYYIDSSSVPNLSEESLAWIKLKREASPAFDQLFKQGLTLLDGSTARDDWVQGECGGLVPFEDRPRLERSDWVQNSNDSYWATNPGEPLTGFSPLFGPTETEQGPRTRLGLKMLQKPKKDGFGDGTQAKWPAGQDGKFDGRDLIQTIYNNRSFWAEQYLPELRDRCNQIGTNSVNLPDAGSRQVDGACTVLSNWDGYYDLDSKGAHVFRVFMANYRKVVQGGGELTTSFDPDKPVTTPADPTTNKEGTNEDNMLQALAQGLQALDKAGVAYNAELGSVQVYQPSGAAPPGGTPQTTGQAFPWHGGRGEIDGAFNAVESRDQNRAKDTLFPIVNVSPIPDTGGLVESMGKWFKIRGTSYHFGLSFTENGPQAYGLTSYSQSTDSTSAFYNDQGQRYSDKNPREFPFTESEIEDNLITNGKRTVTNE